MLRGLVLSLFLVTTLLAQDELTRARRIAASSIGIDSHIDTIQRVLIGGANLAEASTSGHVDFPRLREGGMRAPFFALWVPVYYK